MKHRKVKWSIWYLPSWPKWARVLLVIGFPLVVPLWLGLLASYLVGRFFFDLTAGLRRFCLAPPRHRYRISDYAYHRTPTLARLDEVYDDGFDAKPVQHVN